MFIDENSCAALSWWLGIVLSVGGPSGDSFVVPLDAYFGEASLVVVVTVILNRVMALQCSATSN